MDVPERQGPAQGERRLLALAGNAYDRILYGHVIDFLEVHIVHYHWPDFNVADSAIVVGGILLVLDSFRSSRASSN